MTDDEIPTCDIAAPANLKLNYARKCLMLISLESLLEIAGTH